MPSVEVTARSAADVFVGAAVAHHADGLHRQQHGEGLPDLRRRGRPCGSRRDRSASALRRMSSFSRVTSPGKRMARPGPGNGWRPTKMFGQAELAAERAHLVLEQFAQRLDQLHVHALGQAADIVVRLDGHRRAAGEGDALDHVGIERALREEIRRRRSSSPPRSNTSMNRRPMVLRFFSGSVTRLRARRGRASTASTWTSGML